MSSQSFIQITLIRRHGLDDSGLHEWEKIQTFNAVWAEIIGNHLRFAAGGHKYLFDTNEWDISLKPLI